MIRFQIHFCLKFENSINEQESCIGDNILPFSNGKNVKTSSILVTCKLALFAENYQQWNYGVEITRRILHYSSVDCMLEVSNMRAIFSSQVF